jgi:cytochrome c biogenesis protein CcmG/thiol:disulfide interchange protein DsbE
MRVVTARLAAAVATALLVACGSSKAPADTADAKGRSKPLMVGDDAPRFAVMSLNGDSLIVGDSARAATLVNVWATWCTSCREEFSALEHLQKEFGANSFEIAAISVDQGTDLKVRKFAAAQGSTFRIAHDADSRITSEYGVVGLPTSFLLDKTGHVRWAFTGDFRQDSAGLVSALHATLGK